MMTDLVFVAPCYEIADWVSTQGQKPVYVYQFNHTAEGTVPQWKGAYHEGMEVHTNYYPVYQHKTCRPSRKISSIVMFYCLQGYTMDTM